MIQNKLERPDYTQYSHPINGEKKNYCSKPPAFWCLTMNVQQESECKHFVPSCLVKHERCTQFNFGQCFSKKAKTEAAVERNLG